MEKAEACLDNGEHCEEEESIALLSKTSGMPPKIAELPTYKYFDACHSLRHASYQKISGAVSCSHQAVLNRA